MSDLSPDTNPPGRLVDRETVLDEPEQPVSLFVRPDSSSSTRLSVSDAKLIAHHVAHDIAWLAHHQVAYGHAPTYAARPLHGVTEFRVASTARNPHGSRCLHRRVPTVGDAHAKLRVTLSIREDEALAIPSASP